MKKFLIIGNQNAITYKEVFPYMMKGEICLGYRNIGSEMFFNVQEEYQKVLAETKKEGSAWKKINGEIMGRVANACWFSNLYIQKENTLQLIRTYNPENYSKYDNYDAINVDKVKDIPYDYNGYIGVPITIIDKMGSDGLIHLNYTYEIKGCADADIIPEDWKGMSKRFIELYYKQGNTGCYKEGNRLACYIDKEGKAKVPYKRIMIKKI